MKEVYLKQLNENTWMVADVTIIRAPLASPPPKSCLAHWRDEADGSSFSLMESVEPPTTQLSENTSPTIKAQRPRSFGGSTWTIGTKAILRLETTKWGVTTGFETMEFVREKSPRTFDVPKLLCHRFYENHHCSFIEMPGRTINEAWPTLTPGSRIRYCRAIVDAFDEMASWKGTRVESVKGQPVAQPLLSNILNTGPTFEHPKLYHKITEEIKTRGLDADEVVFFHGNPASEGIIVEHQPQEYKIWFIGWESAGYYPRRFLRTCTVMRGELSVCDWMDLRSPIDHTLRLRVNQEMRHRGYGECNEAVIDLLDVWGNFDFDRADIARGRTPDWW